MMKKKILIVGFGTQGKKRAKFLKKNTYKTLDNNKKADFSNIRDVPDQKFDNIFICTPDKEKNKIISYFLNKNKNLLIEKPLQLNKKLFDLFKKNTKTNKLCLYTAYNHRFEPHIANLKNYLMKNKIGKIYKMRVLYGNGTSKLIQNTWRENRLGIIKDLGSHLLDISYFLLGKKIGNFYIINKKKLENKIFDYVCLANKNSKISIQLEMTYCMWKNTFALDIIGSKGSMHINNLCKWGKSVLEFRKRVFPSGLPNTKKFVLNIKDPTWKLEHEFFLKKKINSKNLLERDNWLNKQLLKLSK